MTQSTERQLVTDDHGIETSIFELRHVESLNDLKNAISLSADHIVESSSVAAPTFQSSFSFINLTSLSSFEVAELCRTAGENSVFANMLQRLNSEQSNPLPPISAFTSQVD